MLVCSMEWWQKSLSEDCTKRIHHIFCMMIHLLSQFFFFLCLAAILTEDSSSPVPLSFSSVIHRLSCLNFKLSHPLRSSSSCVKVGLNLPKKNTIKTTTGMFCNLNSHQFCLGQSFPVSSHCVRPFFPIY